MPSCSRHRDVVVRLFGGQSDQHELVLEAGCPRPPLALGTHGGWVIQGRLIAKVHLFLAFNGQALFVGTAAGEAAILDRAPLEARWTQVPIPSKVRFGSARLSIARRSDPDAETTQAPSLRAARPEAKKGARILRARPRVWTDDRVTTCIDDRRLQEALELTRATR